MFKSEHWLDHNGKPAGGCSQACGITISWQNGPLGRGEDRKEPNGAFVETVLGMVKDRIEFYNNNGFPCDENYKAIEKITEAMDVLNERTKRREEAGVEGTHGKD